jgi:hypothetical protein
MNAAAVARLCAEGMAEYGYDESVAAADWWRFP